MGSASARTPILPKPLSGPIYLVNSPGLPLLGVQLNGQVKLRVEARSSVVGTRIRTTFGTVPDVPLSSFALTFRGGTRGILKTGSNLCAKPQRAGLAMVGQNGISRSRTITISRSCKEVGAAARTQAASAARSSSVSAREPRACGSHATSTDAPDAATVLSGNTMSCASVTLLPPTRSTRMRTSTLP